MTLRQFKAGILNVLRVWSVVIGAMLVAGAFGAVIVYAGLRFGLGWLLIGFATVWITGFAFAVGKDDAGR